MLDRSPIEQALIDGVLYWDKIGENWHRLLHRTTQDVWGHYKLTRFFADRWVAVLNPGVSKLSSGTEQREFDTQQEAREWVELAAAKRLHPKTGAHGWPLVPSTAFPGELTLACPKCGSTNVTLTVAYGPGGRLGDPGATDIIRCETCHHADYKPELVLGANDKTGGRAWFYSWGMVKMQDGHKRGVLGPDEDGVLLY